ncbi:ABC transport system [Bacteroides pyogenes JCM 10003]|nr:ABC transport system [Bacteroides pyogenes JCM 10003]
MNYNFDEIIDRSGTDSVKWDGVEAVWGRNDLMPMWVADMDFRTAPCVIEALKKRLEHEVLGYTMPCKEWGESIVRWLKERHGWAVTERMLTFTPGIVRGLAFAIHCFTEKADKVMVMPPVYPPFFSVTQCTGREVVFSPLQLKDGRYEIDFERLPHDVRGCKLLILCNPHNPGEGMDA